jgi:hypothetical protein
MLQIHGGCDVRGGYTKPQIFEGSWEEVLCRDGSFYVRCPICEEEWSTDDGGYHWYPFGNGPTLKYNDNDEWEFDEDAEEVYHVGCTKTEGRIRKKEIKEPLIFR